MASQINWVIVHRAGEEFALWSTVAINAYLLMTALLTIASIILSRPGRTHAAHAASPALSLGLMATASDTPWASDFDLFSVLTIFLKTSLWTLPITVVTVIAVAVYLNFDRLAQLQALWAH